MKTKFGALIVDGRGKIGGQVASRNRAGSYLRNKVTPVNPRTAAQSAVRSRFATLSSGWRNLSQTVRDSWNNAVAGYQKSDIFSDLHSLTGLQLYQRLNNNILSSGGTQITSPAPNKGVLTVAVSTLTYTSGTPALTLVSAAVVPALTRVKVFATPPLSQGVNFVKAQLRQITTLAPAATASQVLTTAYNTKFGSVGGVGTKIFIGVVYVDQTSGISSPMQLISAIAAT
jgi:hypothetical protein